MAYRPISKEQYDAAVSAAEKRSSRVFAAQAVSYNPASDQVEIALTDTLTAAVARLALTEWQDVPKQQFETIRLSAIGDALALGSHDVQIDLLGLMIEEIPDVVVATAMAKRAGSRTSEAKAVAARANGALGGRPKKTVVAAG